MKAKQRVNQAKCHGRVEQRNTLSGEGTACSKAWEGERNTGRTKMVQHVGDFAKDLGFQPLGNGKTQKGLKQKRYN